MSKSPAKRSKKAASEEFEVDTTDGLTKRMLLSMVFDITQLEKNVQHIKVKVFTVAKAHGIVPPQEAEED